MILESILSFLGGAGVRLVSEFLAAKEKQKDRDHEFRMFDLQLEADKQRSVQKLGEMRVEMEGREVLSELGAMTEAARAQSTRSGIQWLDGLNASVRPVLTYWWCVVLYTVNKIILMYVALKSEVPLSQIAGVVFTEFDAGVVASMIGFWFVDRAIRKRSGK